MLDIGLRSEREVSGQSGLDDRTFCISVEPSFFFFLRDISKEES